jgi:hypothetical protein
MANLKDIVQENMNKFSFAQMTSNNNGKTSGSGTCGIYLVFIGGVIGVMGAISSLYTKSPDAANVLLFATGTIMTGAGLLGYRKSKDGPIESTTPEEPTPPTQ